ncbi:DUF2285 domain-containing protein [Pseudomonas aeruginosa]|uniref:DUF2285 domain-containing protein n=1 Tax=Pseudomonas aeruginosa TaxID=287 RepID=UPI003917E4E5
MVPRSRCGGAALPGCRPAAQCRCLRVLERPRTQTPDPRWHAPGAGIALARLLRAARTRAGPGRWHGLPLCHPRLRHALLELHTLQVLDATLAGASLRVVAEGLFGADAVAADWHKDSALRARVRRLVRRGDALMRGGYRRLAQLSPPLH